LKINKNLNWLIPLTAVLAGTASLCGLLWRNGPGPYDFITHRGTSTVLSGRGLYQFDSLFISGSFLGTDVITLVIGIPLLIIAYLLYRKSSIRGAFLLAGALSFFLYNGASMAFGAAYNALFLVYTGLFAVSLFSFIIVFQSINTDGLLSGIKEKMPEKGLAVFLFISGAILAFVWLSDIAAGFASGSAPPLLGTYTTMVTYVLDLGVILPAILISGVLILRKKSAGYVLGFVMIFLCAVIGIIVIAQTIAQVALGITYTSQQLIVFISSFIIMSGFALWLAVLFLKNISPGSADGT